MRLDQVSIAELLEKLASGEFTSETLVTTYIARIEQVNAKVHAVSEVNSHALDIAREKDRERSCGQARGILHGIPILIKSICMTTDGMQCTFGSTGLLGAIPDYEATTVTKLRSEGAIILGVTVSSQWAGYRFASAWSAVGGQCTGIHYKDQTPSGSSSGSAVAAALGLCAAALGTETVGSIVGPAQKAAVVGLKPTVGLTSRYGVYAASEWQDTIGVLATSVKDAALVLTAIAGPDPNDPFTIRDPRDSTSTKKLKEGTDFGKACRSLRLDGVRIAVPRHSLRNLDSTTVHLFNDSLEIIKNLGATVIDPAKYSKFDVRRAFIPSDDDYELAMQVDFYHNMTKSLIPFHPNPSSLHNLGDVINHIKTHPSELYNEYGADYFEECLRTGERYPKSSPEYQSSLSSRHQMGEQIPELLDRYEADLIVSPTEAGIEPADVGGCPLVSVPMGYYPEGTEEKRVQRKGNEHLVEVGAGVPIGICFVGRRWDDERLVEVAYAFEQATRVREKGRPIVKSDIELPLKMKGKM